MLSFLKTILIVAILTVLTQIGGVIYLFYKPAGGFLKKKIKPPIYSLILRSITLFLFLSVFSLFIIPPIAKQYGRVPLPLFATKQAPLKPANFLTVIANRHYVTPALKAAIIKTAQSIDGRYPGTQLIYLDANFPFWNEFPLLPHRSHDDGKKLDICFLSNDSK